MLPMVPMLHGPEGRTSRLPGHLTTEGRTRAWPSFLADEGAPQPARHKRLHLASLQAPISSPAAVVARGPQRAPSLRTCTQEEGGHRDRRTASTPAMAAAAAKNIAKKSASYAHANPRLNKETSAIIVSSRTLASNPCPPLFREHTLALSRMNRGERGAACVPINCRKPPASTLSAGSISRRQIKVIADEVRSFLPYLGQTRNDAPSAL
jgi:hypothetical protein